MPPFGSDDWLDVRARARHAWATITRGIRVVGLLGSVAGCSLLVSTSNLSGGLEGDEAPTEPGSAHDAATEMDEPRLEAVDAGASGDAEATDAADASSFCEPGQLTEFNPVTGHCYRLHLDRVNWSSAQQACESAGGHLAVVTTANEHVLVGGLASRNAVGSWIGATDSATEGKPTWVNGEAWSFSAWADGEPNGGKSENCVETTALGMWNDVLCTALRTYICESE